MLLAVLFAVTLLGSVCGHQDEIKNLPGLPANYNFNFRQYAGEVLVNSSHGRNLFYWFVESQNKPETDPIVLWLNGGPGCSSLGGFFTENGPFWPDPQANLTVNPFSWNKVANVIYLESPSGVGFSYSTTTADYVTGDAQTANDSYIFLQRFFQMYPEFQGRPFWVSGESYGGHYVPELAAAILDGNAAGTNIFIDLQGHLVGNAWTDAPVDNLGAVKFWYHHNMISKDTWTGITGNCDFAVIGPLAASNACQQYLQRAQQEMGNIDIYDVYETVCLSEHNNGRQLMKLLSQTPSAFAPAALRLATPRAPAQNPCIGNFAHDYLNRADVQEAIHAPKLPYVWHDCSPRVAYSYKDLLTSVVPVYRRLLSENDARPTLRILVYTGDVDGIVPFPGTRDWILELNLTVTEPWRPWTDYDQQVGGYTVAYEKGFYFASIRNAGHMVPGTQPSRALAFFSRFIAGEPL